MEAQETSALTRRGVQIVIAAREMGVSILLTGSTAIDSRCPAGRGLVARNNACPRDIDFVARSRCRAKIPLLMAAHGFATRPDVSMHPYTTRDVFWGICAGQRVRADVVYDFLAYVHMLDVRDDLDADGPTISLENLLMSKLQIRTLGLRDIVHICAVLLQCTSEEMFAGPYGMRAVLLRAGKDYRCERDFLRSLRIVLLHIRGGDLRLEQREFEDLTSALRTCIDLLGATKRGSRWWIGRAKALVGIDLPEPEEDDEVPAE